MLSRTFFASCLSLLPVPFAILALTCSLGVRANAATIAVTYSFDGGPVGPEVMSGAILTVDHLSTGSILSSSANLNAVWNPFTLLSHDVVDYAALTLNGASTITFADGSTLSGHQFVDFSNPLYPETLSFTGGTGEFTGATGLFSGESVVFASGGFTVSGTGTINAPSIPEPASAALLLAGLALIGLARRSLRIVLVSCLSLLPIHLSASPVVYAITGSLQFGRIDLATGSFSPISSASPIIQYLTQGPNGSLLTESFDGNLDSIDPATGGLAVIGATGFADCSTPDLPTCGNNSQLSFGAAGGTYYATDFANRLYSVNPVTGKATLIGNTGIPAVPFIPASVTDGHLNFYDENLFDVSGFLYANFDAGTFDFATEQTTPVIAPALYRINTTTGAATRISDTDFGLVTITTINGAAYGFSGPNGQAVALNVTNGKTTVLSDIDPALGLIAGAAPVPEPAPFVLSGLSVVGGLVWVRRRDRLRKLHRPTA